MVCIVRMIRLVYNAAPYPVWFQHYRKENFYDTSLPQGKWTKRESKQNWVQCDAKLFVFIS